MSAENLQKFQEAVSASPELRAKIQSIHSEDVRRAAGEIAALSAEIGIPVAAADLLVPANGGAEVSDEALENVAGGGHMDNYYYNSQVICLVNF